MLVGAGGQFNKYCQPQGSPIAQRIRSSKIRKLPAAASSPARTSRLRLPGEHLVAVWYAGGGAGLAAEDIVAYHFGHRSHFPYQSCLDAQCGESPGQMFDHGIVMAIV